MLDDHARTILNEYQKLAEEQGLADQICWITGYRPIDEAVGLLALCDYVVFPYRDTRESGAATIGLASRRPVLVSPLPIFSDLSDCTRPLEGHDAKAPLPASGRWRRLRTKRRLRAAAGAMARRRQWPRVSARFGDNPEGSGSIARSKRSAPQPVAAPAAESGAPRQLLVDVSELYYRDARTGIQRVVRSILGEPLARAPAGYRVRAPYSAPLMRATAMPSASGKSAWTIRMPERQYVTATGTFSSASTSVPIFSRRQKGTFARRGSPVYASTSWCTYIIPLMAPQFAVEPLREAFGLWIRSIARVADSLVCISASVAVEVRYRLGEYVGDSPLLKVGHFHLGADLENSQPTRGFARKRDDDPGSHRQRAKFLMVGTIEPRRAIHRRWRFALGRGRIGQSGHRRQGRMDDRKLLREPTLAPGARETPFLARRHQRRIPRTLYAVSTCLIAASEAEGFPASPIEAAQHGLPISARDLPVFREIAGDKAYYFFPGSIRESSVTAVRTWLTLRETNLVPRSGAIPWLTWQQSTAQLLERVLSED